MLLVNACLGGKDTNMNFKAMVRQRLDALGTSAITAAEAAGLPRDAIRYVLRGHQPSLDRAAEICEALGLELLIKESFNAPDGTFGKAGEPLKSQRWQSRQPEIDSALLSEIIYGVIAKAAEDGMMLRFDQVAAEASRIYAAEMAAEQAGTDGDDDGTADLKQRA